MNYNILIALVFGANVSDNEVLKTLKDYKHHLDIAGPAKDIFRSMGWGILKFLVEFTDWMSNASHEALSLFGLLDKGHVVQFIQDSKPALMALFALTLLYLGIKMILGARIKLHDKFIAVVIALIFLSSLSNSTETATDITKKATEDVDNYTSEQSNAKIGTNILKNSVVDLKYMDEEQKWKKPESDVKDGRYNKLSNSSVEYIDINETIKQGKAETDLGKEVTKKQISMKSGGKEEVKDLDGGFWGIGEKEYYRYSVYWARGMTGLLCAGLGYFFAGLAIASIILETIVGLFIASFGASTLQSDKLKSTIVDMLNGLVAIVFVFICMFIFKELLGFIMNKNITVYIIGMIAGLKFMFDGPRIIERKFGYDAGLQSPIRSLMAGYGLAKAGASVSKAGVNKFKSTVDGAKKSFNSNTSNSTNNPVNTSQNSTNKNQDSSNVNDINEKNDNNTQGNNDNKNLGEQAQQNADNQGYVDSPHTSDLESEKNQADSNAKASGGSQHDQLWANKPEGSVLGRSSSQNLTTQSFNNNNGKEASINNKVGNDVVKQGANNTSVNAQNTTAPSNSSVGGYNTPKESSSVGGYNTPKESSSGGSRYGNSNKTVNGFNSKTSARPHSSGKSNIPKSHQSARSSMSYTPKTQPVRTAKQSTTHNMPKNKSQGYQRPLARNNQASNKIKPKR
ncbi:MAG: hypothetical protein E7J02_13405 [Staphylococcus warneri]|uniref:pLS20_p028 family conjugation system transmembrane protein n=1 Tax=Staphylococcus aureus TaxID=1280 RepID=UPI0029117CC5|nr:hypothetical protein [Staphylococcus warneri]MDU5815219.1 hypothetical protein [Staphylococcus sp.]